MTTDTIVEVDTPAAAMRVGALRVAPLLLGIVPFGLIAGASAIEVGLGMGEAVGLSTIVFAGASQLAAIDLLGRGAPVAVVVLTALVINLRMLMYGASIAPHFAHLSLRKRAAAAYVLTDQAYALSVVQFSGDGGRTPRLAYYLGVGLPLWISWQIATVTGALVGSTIPDAIPLTFAVPLTFLALLQPTITDRPTTYAAVSAAFVAVVADPLPANLGMPLAAVTGILVGVFTSPPDAVETAEHAAGHERSHA